MNGGNAGPDPAIITDRSIGAQRDVEIHPDEDTFSLYIDIRHSFLLHVIHPSIPGMVSVPDYIKMTGSSLKDNSKNPPVVRKKSKPFLCQRDHNQ